MSITGTEQPTKVGVPIADLIAGMNGAFGVVAALHERDADRPRPRRAHVAAGRAWSACTPSRAPAGPSPARCPAWPATTTRRSRRTACSRRRPRRCRSRAAPRACGARCAAAFGWDPAEAGVRDQRRCGSPTATRWSRGSRRSSPSEPAEHWLAALSDAGVPSGKVRSMDDVYTWDQTLSQGLLLDGRARDPGLAEAARARRSASTTTPFSGGRSDAPRSPDARPAQRVDPGVARGSWTAPRAGRSQPAVRGRSSCRRTRTGGRPRTRGRRTSGGPWRRAGSRRGPSGTPARPRARCATTPGRCLVGRLVDPHRLEHEHLELRSGSFASGAGLFAGSTL